MQLQINKTSTHWLNMKAIAIKLACEHFHQYIYGRYVQVQTDHKDSMTAYLNYRILGLKYKDTTSKSAQHQESKCTQYNMVSPAQSRDPSHTTQYCHWSSDGYLLATSFLHLFCPTLCSLLIIEQWRLNICEYLSVESSCGRTVLWKDKECFHWQKYK